MWNLAKTRSCSEQRQEGRLLYRLRWCSLDSVAKVGRINFGQVRSVNFDALECASGFEESRADFSSADVTTGNSR